MSDVFIRFEREGLDGVVAVGSYLSDVFRRFGVRSDDECKRADGVHACEVTITEGADHLSDLTDAETEHFAVNGRRSNRRLACEAKIIEPGEVTIMTDEKKDAPKTEAPKKDKFQEEFDALPLDKKITQLMRMEVVTLGETFSYVVNQPLRVIEKVGDVIADFGMKLEAEAKKAARPKEHKSKAKAATSETPPKGHASRKSSPPPKP